MWVCVCECVWPVCWFTGNTRPKEFPRWSQPYLPPIKIHELQLMILVSSLTEWLDFSWRWSDIVSTAPALRCLYPSSWRNVNLIVTSCFVRNLGKKVWREQSTPVNIVCGISPHTTDQEHCSGVTTNRVTTLEQFAFQVSLFFSLFVEKKVYRHFVYTCIDFRLLNKITVKNKYPLPCCPQPWSYCRGHHFHQTWALQRVPSGCLPSGCGGFPGSGERHFEGLHESLCFCLPWQLSDVSEDPVRSWESCLPCSSVATRETSVCKRWEMQVPHLLVSL